MTRIPPEQRLETGAMTSERAAPGLSQGWKAPYLVPATPSGPTSAPASARPDGRAGARYASALLQHLQSPRHLLKADAPDFPWNGIGRLDVAGDARLTIWIQVDEGELVRLVWKAEGLPQVVASSSAFAELVLTGGADGGPMTVARALKVTPQQVVEALGGASRLLETARAPEAFQRAVQDYLRRQGLLAEKDTVPGHGVDEDAVCHCWGVTASSLQALAATGASFETARETLGVSTGCGSCYADARALFEWAGTQAREVQAAQGLWAEEV